MVNLWFVKCFCLVEDFHFMVVSVACKLDFFALLLDCCNNNIFIKLCSRNVFTSWIMNATVIITPTFYSLLDVSDEDDSTTHIQQRGEDYSVLLQRSGK